MRNPEEDNIIEKLRTFVRDESSDISQAIADPKPEPWAVAIMKSVFERPFVKNISIEEGATLLLSMLSAQEMTAADVVDGLKKADVKIEGNSPMIALKLISDLQSAELVSARDSVSKNEDADRIVPYYKISEKGRTFLKNARQQEMSTRLTVLGLVTNENSA